MKMIIITYTSRNFTFEGAGRDNLEAWRALKAAAMEHKRQYGDRVADDFIDEVVAGVEFRLYEFGAGYRDGEKITNNNGKD